jgi:hypothetical protein
MRDAEKRLFRSKAEAVIREDRDSSSLLCCQGCGVIITHEPLGVYMKCHCGHETHWSDFQAGYLYGFHAMFHQLKTPFKGCS